MLIKRSNRLILFDTKFGKDVQAKRYQQSKFKLSVINDALLKNIDKAFSYIKHSHNQFLLPSSTFVVIFMV